jgi:cell wall-associated NlpC family hydrolase
MVARCGSLVFLVLLLAGCASRPARVVRHPQAPRPLRPRILPRIEYSVQVGAFSDPDNAVRLIETLSDRGLEAFYFVGEDGLHRVRFGSFSSKELAVQRAETLREEQVIDAYYVVAPRAPSAGRGDAALRGEVVRSAMSFLGLPYRWGGPSPETGFDCSGLTMTAYRLGGIDLPRTAMEQYAVGEAVPPEELQEADLVFFATGSGSRPTHVGLYVGNGRFVHAPREGGVVRIDALSDGYYQRRLLGGRSYLGASADTVSP